MDFDELLERVFFPTHMGLLGASTLILLSMDTPFFANEVFIFFLSIIAYGISRYFTKQRASTLTKKYTYATSTSFLVLLIGSVLLAFDRNFLFGIYSAIIANFVVHILRDEWKISAHTMGYSLLAATLSIVDPIFIPLFSLLPMVIYNRLALVRHSKNQAIAGVAVGISIPLVVRLLMNI